MESDTYVCRHRSQAEEVGTPVLTLTSAVVAGAALPAIQGNWTSRFGIPVIKQEARSPGLLGEERPGRENGEQSAEMMGQKQMTSAYKEI